MLASIPMVVWVALIGFLSAIAGAIIGQLGVSRQLRHDAKQRRLDRETTIRREVYLGAVVGVAQLQEYLASFAKTQMSEQERENLSHGAFGAINKTYLVAQPDTIQALLTLYEEFSRAVVRLGQKQTEIMLLTARTDRSRENHAEAVRRTQQLQAAVTSAGQSGRGDLVGQLLSTVKSAETESQKALDVIEEAESLLNQAKIGLIAEVMNQNRAFEVAAENAVVLMREELGFETDEEQFRKMMNDSGEISRNLSSELVERLNVTVQEVQKEFGTNQASQGQHTYLPTDGSSS